MVAVKIIDLLQCVDAGPGIMVRLILVNVEASVVGHFYGMHQPRRRELAPEACENPIK